MNLKIPNGKITAIVGGSGTGKSTLGSLLLRFYDPNSGSILLDNKDITTLDPRWLRQQIGTVSQEPILFSTTIRDNILYGAINPESITDERLHEVTKEANAYDFIMSFADNFQTLVGERGKTLNEKCFIGSIK